MERFPSLPFSPNPATTEPLCRRPRFPASAPNQPAYVPVSGRASCAHAGRRTGNLRAAGACGEWRTRGRPARHSRDTATRAGIRAATTGLTRPPLGGSAAPRRLCRGRRRRGVAKPYARWESVNMLTSDTCPPWPFRALPAHGRARDRARQRRPRPGKRRLPRVFSPFAILTIPFQSALGVFLRVNSGQQSIQFGRSAIRCA